MTSSKTNVLRHIRLKAFRGFRDAQNLELDASAIIVSGPNGTGKTSLFDAIQWCLTGSLSRVEDLRAKRNIEHIVNQYRIGDRAEVDLTLAFDGTEVLLKRVGDHRGSSLELHNPAIGSSYGDEAEEALRDLLSIGADVGLELSLATTGLMQQDVMRAMLQAKPAERYRHISTILGLGALEDFEDAVRAAAADANKLAEANESEQIGAESRLTDVQQRLNAARVRLEQQPSREALRADFERSWPIAPEWMVAPKVPSHDITEYRQLAATAAEVTGTVVSLRQQAEALQARGEDLGGPVEDSALRTASRLVATVQSQLEEKESARGAALQELGVAEQVATEMTRLAAVAIPLLTHVCPVCRQSIDQSQISSSLRERSGETATILALRKGLQEAEHDLKSVQQSLAEAESGLVALEASSSAWDRHVALQAHISSEVLELRKANFEIRLGEHLEEWAVRSGEANTYLETLRQINLAAADALATQGQSVELARYESEIDSFAAAAADRKARAEESRRRASTLKTLLQSTIDARVEVTEKQFRSVQPLVADIFGRLDPHPTFKSIDFELDTYYRKGTTSPLVRDLVEGISADPLVIFSTSQANIAALSYFLAMGWSAGERALPFVLLDDPIQSMDDINVLGFADLSRHLRISRQLAVSTHERRFASLLERKLAPRQPNESTLVLEFQGWDRSGPAIDTRSVSSQLDGRPIRIVRDAS